MTLPLRLATWLLGVVALACGESNPGGATESCIVGALGCGCFDNATCFEGLLCSNGICTGAGTGGAGSVGAGTGGALVAESWRSVLIDFEGLSAVDTLEAAALAYPEVQFLLDSGDSMYRYSGYCGLPGAYILIGENPWDAGRKVLAFAAPIRNLRFDAGCLDARVGEIVGDALLVMEDGSTVDLPIAMTAWATPVDLSAYAPIVRMEYTDFDGAGTAFDNISFEIRE